MYCGLIVGNNIVNIGGSSPSPGGRLKGRGWSRNSSRMQSSSRHAELDALRYFRTHPQVRKAQLVVVRYKNEGDALAFGDSRPCACCIHRIVRYHPNVTRVTFFEDGIWITETPSQCAIRSEYSSGDKRLK
mmetsp:Transcript_41462/g.87023  ORF Transcript_41462/g.87023 Transcript_41462/m.87023 type:complete len:131 (+) Transcript_41462:326-718(+)